MRKDSKIGPAYRYLLVAVLLAGLGIASIPAEDPAAELVLIPQIASALRSESLLAMVAAALLAFVGSLSPLAWAGTSTSIAMLLVSLTCILAGNEPLAKGTGDYAFFLALGAVFGRLIWKAKDREEDEVLSPFRRSLGKGTQPKSRVISMRSLIDFVRLMLATSARRRRLLLSGVFAALMICPLMFWSPDGTYRVGGDDSLLYYMYPAEMLAEWSVNIVRDNGLSVVSGYGQQLYTVPFFTLLWLLKTVTPFMNTQMLSYGMNLGFGFLSFYLFLGLWIKESDPAAFGARIVGALAYATSIFSAYTLWASQLFSLYLVSILPLVLFLVITGVRAKAPRRVVGAALLISLFSVDLLATPWLLPVLLGLLPLLTPEFRRFPTRVITYSTVFVVLVVGLNAYWIYHLVGSSGGGAVSGFPALGFDAGQRQLIEVVSDGNSVAYPFFHLFHRSVLERFGSSLYPIFRDWNLRLLPLNLVLPAIALGALAVSIRRGSLIRAHALALIGLLLAMYFYTVRIGSFGLEAFLWLSNRVPGFVMFRNMYDKFGLSLATMWGLTLAFGLVLSMRRAGALRIKFAGLTVVLIIVLLNAKPFLAGELFQSPLWTTKSTFSSVRTLNSDFLELAEYLESVRPSGRIAWLPLNLANYVQIRDSELANHYYSGVSPLRFLSGVNDVSGVLSFGKQGDNLVDAITSRRADRLGEILKLNNVEYLVINHDLSEELKNSYLFSYQGPGDFLEAQSTVLNEISGEKIRDFGTRYSLHKISDTYRSETYAFQPAGRSSEETADFKKFSAGSYLITLRSVGSGRFTFLEPYDPRWALKAASADQEVSIKRAPSSRASNSWLIDTRDRDNTSDQHAVELHLYFQPEEERIMPQAVSLGLAILCLGYMTLGLKGRRRQRHMTANQDSRPPSQPVEPSGESIKSSRA